MKLKNLGEIELDINDEMSQKIIDDINSNTEKRLENLEKSLKSTFNDAFYNLNAWYNTRVLQNNKQDIETSNLNNSILWLLIILSGLNLGLILILADYIYNNII